MGAGGEDPLEVGAAAAAVGVEAGHQDHPHQDQAQAVEAVGVAVGDQDHQAQAHQAVAGSHLGPK